MLPPQKEEINYKAHYPGALEKIFAAATSNPSVAAVLKVFEQSNGALLWSAALEYLVVTLLDHCSDLEQRVLKSAQEASPCLILPSSSFQLNNEILKSG